LLWSRRGEERFAERFIMDSVYERVLLDLVMQSSSESDVSRMRSGVRMDDITVMLSSAMTA
jgi:hypothetical protein